MVFEYNITDEYSINNFIIIKDNRLIIKQNFGEPGIIIKFNGNNIDDISENKIIMKVLVESNRKILVGGNCISGKKSVDSEKETEIIIEPKSQIVNQIKIFIRNPNINDWFKLNKFNLISPYEITIEKMINIDLTPSYNLLENNLLENNISESPQIDNKIELFDACEDKGINIANPDDDVEIIELNLKYQTKLETDREIFANKGIKQIIISESLKEYNRIQKLYNLKNYYNNKEPCLFFGLYNRIDIERLQKHEGDKYVMYGGTDCDFRFTERNKNFEKIKDMEIKYISISEDIEERLKSKNKESELIKIDLVEYEKFVGESKGNKIYVYLGRKEIEEKEIGTERDIYGYKEYLEIKERFPEFEFIESNKINKKYDEMADIYKECFIGLRLTKHDGNANTVKEMGALGIPVVHNGKEKNCLNWKTIDDIELNIKYVWIERLMKDFSKYKDILFISTDYPNYGGIATNTLKLINFFEKNNHRVFGLYHAVNAPEYGMYDNNIYITDNLKKGINRTKKFFGKDPDLIIIRNYTEINIIRSRFTSKVFFMVPGIFLPNINKRPDEIKSKKEFDEIAHPKIISCIMRSYRVFTNNCDTMQLLNKYCNINTEIFYFMNLPFYGKKYMQDEDWYKREYDLGVIISDYTRPVKNIPAIRRILERNPEKNKIVIGKNSNILKDIPNTTIIDLIPNNEVLEKLKKIKYLINESYVEKLNNTILEAKYQGCKIYEDTIENTNILIVSTQYPNYGGGATLAYKFHEYLLNNKINSYCLFLDKNYKLKNPNKLKNVDMYDIDLQNDINKLEKLKASIQNEIGKPDIIIGFNYVAPFFIKKVFNECKVAYYMTGSKYISDVGMTSDEFINRKERKLNEIVKEELKTIEGSDYIIPNSYLTESVFSDTYYNYYNKLESILPLEYLFYEKQEEKEEKEYDILVVASRYDRQVKNIELVKDIFESIELKDYKKCCIGKFSDKFISKENNTTHLGFLDDKKIDEIMAKSKIIIITSKFESMSITLIKGLKNNCIILTNKNVGASYLVDNTMIMENFNKEEWINKIKIILNNYDYNKKVIKNNLEFLNFNFLDYIKKIVHKENKKDKHILICSIDTPYIGGSATNSYNMIKELRKKGNKVSGLFISGKEDELDPDKIGNIYFALMDKEIEKRAYESITKIMADSKIDIILVKNYKCFCIINFIIKKYYKKQIPIIFSPSGSKYVSDMREIDKLQTIQIDNEYIENLDNSELYELITKYDDNIEIYVMNKAQNILPNSELTYNILKKIYNNEINLSFPINITYIDYKNNNLKLEREYDVGFICYSWKRKIKGGDIMKNIIKNLNPNLKILVVGLNSGLKSNDNITVKDNLNHEELLKFMNKTKILCFTSYYDSSPNVLKEAISCGCKIILTENIGNSEIIEKEYVVKLEDYEIWKEKIEKLLKTNHQNIINDEIYNNIPDKLINYIESCIKFNNENIKESVGIYKVPAEWDTEHLGNFDDYIKENIELKTINIKNYGILQNEIFRNIKSDIYFEMFIKESINREIKKINWLIVSKDFYKNSKVLLNRFRPYENKNIEIYLINNCKELFYFKNRTFYYVRGNYYNLYDKLTGNNETILYPATALIYNQNLELQVQKVINYNFKYVLYDEPLNKDLWQQMFPKSKLIHFIKKPNNEFMYIEKERIYDIIFVASENQSTKNHHLFIEMLKYFDEQKYNLNILYVGNLKEINNLNLGCIKLDIKFWVNHDELISLYNQSKINILFSGRDALPRVLIESLSCGCFNIALDTLSDGKYLLNNEVGQLLSFDLDKKYDKTKKSISYVSSNKIFEKIFDLIKNKYNHKEISIKFKTL